MEAQHEDNHGQSVAAWTLVGICLIGAVIGSIAVLIPSVVLGIVSAIVILLGVIAGKVLSMAGYGTNPHGVEREHGLLRDGPDESGTASVGKS
ncbi:MAG: hypothetical protein L0H25_02725 [Micrococcales bacterium]|nr:hypothetical protein [Micrococcales bacterium]